MIPYMHSEPEQLMVKIVESVAAGKADRNALHIE